jgi:hypothetical protein
MPDAQVTVRSHLCIIRVCGVPVAEAGVASAGAWSGGGQADRVVGDAEQVRCEGWCGASRVACADAVRDIVRLGIPEKGGAVPCGADERVGPGSNATLVAVPSPGIVAALHQRDDPEHDRRDNPHHGRHRTHDSPGERIHTVTIRTPRPEHLTI